MRGDRAGDYPKIPGFQQLMRYGTNARHEMAAMRSVRAAVATDLPTELAYADQAERTVTQY